MSWNFLEYVVHVVQYNLALLAHQENPNHTAEASRALRDISRKPPNTRDALVQGPGVFFHLFTFVYIYVLTIFIP
jgi:hypothetical protein